MKRRNNKRGFTLAELLIAVAIIAVLVAVAVPTFNSQLEKSRENTDLANLRAARAAAVAAYLTADTTDTLLGDLWKATDSKDTVNCAFNTATGKLVTTNEADTIGKGTTTPGGCETTTFGTYTYSQGTNAQNMIISVSITKTGDVTVQFADKPTTPTEGDGTT